METKKSIYKDRRLIFLIFALAIAGSLLYPIGLPIAIAPYTRAAYDYIESLPATSVVILSTEYDMKNFPEVGYGHMTLAKRCFELGFKIIILAWMEGSPMVNRRVYDSIDKTGKTYGVDWVEFGYFPGGKGPGVAALAQDWRSVSQMDFYGNNIDTLPLMENINGAEDIDVIIAFVSESAPWLQYWYGPYETNLVFTGQALYITMWLPQWNAGQLHGFIGGARGFAEYERLLGRPGVATSFVDAINSTHLVILIGVVIGNILYWKERLTEKGKTKGGDK